MTSLLDYDILEEQYPITSEFLKILDTEGAKAAKAFALLTYPSESLSPLPSKTPNTFKLNEFIHQLEDQGYVYCPQHASTNGIDMHYSLRITLKGMNAYKGLLAKQAARLAKPTVKAKSKEGSVIVGDGNTVTTTNHQGEEKSFKAWLKRRTSEIITSAITTVIVTAVILFLQKIDVIPVP